MADNYLQFSAELKDLSPAEIDWLKSMLKSTDEMTEEELKQWRTDPSREESWPNFEWKIVGNDLWIYAGEFGNPYNVAELIQKFLATFRPNHCWHMTWAETCSKLRIGEFGGGAIFVTSAGWNAIHTSDWVQNELEGK